MAAPVLECTCCAASDVWLYICEQCCATLYCSQSCYDWDLLHHNHKQLCGQLVPFAKEPRQSWRIGKRAHGITREKAWEMIHNPPHGKPLSKKQLSYFWWIYNGRGKAKSKISGQQIVWRDDPTIGILDVEKLWELTKGHPVRSVSTASLDFLLDASVWSCDEGAEEPSKEEVIVTPRQILDNPQLCPEHWRRIREADTSFPLLVLWPVTSPVPVDVLDGFHRLANAFLFKRPSLDVVVVSEADMKQARLQQTKPTPIN